MSNIPNNERIQELRAELEDELGCCVIIWVKDDYPGTEEQKQERFIEHCDSMCDRLIEIGNETIYNEYGSDDNEEEDTLVDRDDDFIESEPDYSCTMGRRTEGGRTIYEEDFIYDPLRGDC